MSDGQANQMPVFQDCMNPMLVVLRGAGKVLEVGELDAGVISQMEIPASVLAVIHKGKRNQSEVAYRLGWTRSYLKKAGLIETAGRGKYRISSKGEAAGEIDAFALARDVGDTYRDEDDEVDEGDEAQPAADPSVGRDLALSEIRQLHSTMQAAGELRPVGVVAQALARFAERFGPDALSKLDGEALLLAMHGRRSKDSLAYWLEFKNDEEHPAIFGSISGGSALKFGIYQAADGDRWMTGNPRQQRQLELEEAVLIARSQRDQLLAGVRVLRAHEKTPSTYTTLQKQLMAAAPDVAPVAWGHKYFFLLFSSTLAPFHSVEYQRMQLHKLLQVPSLAHYENDGLFTDVARGLGLSTTQLAEVLYKRHGAMQSYWRVGTSFGETNQWQRMRAGNYMAIGWDLVGDLTQLETGATGSDELRARLVSHYGTEGQATTKAERQLNRFAFDAREGDLILAMDGATVLGIGRLAEPYQFRSDDGDGAHRRKVVWLDTAEWRLPEAEGLRTAFVRLKNSENLIEVERRLLQPRQAPQVAPSVPAALAPLGGQVARIDAILQRKRQVVLHGPPGTGKTYWAERAARQLAARAWFNGTFESITDAQRKELETSAIELCSFHPAYGYEDFLEGYRPRAAGNGSLAFELRDGIFKRLCNTASRNPARPYFLIIDEINRGDVPRIFGELLTVLEREKRGRAVRLPLSGEPFAVPDNVFVLGTMNTADRSIALLDVALRRRFGFFELPPDPSTLAGVTIEGLPVLAWFEALNRRIVEHLGRDARHLQIGHSYFLSAGKPIRELGRFMEVLRDDVVPLLEEYCYDDASALEKILGSRFMHPDKRRVNTALFDSIRHGELLSALISSFPEIAATPAAIAADAEATEDEDGDSTV